MANQPQFTITVKGLDKVTEKFAGSKDVVNKYLQLAINFSLFEIQSEVRRHTPVITGRLKGGIERLEDSRDYFLTDDSNSKGLSGMVISTVFYGRYVHKKTPFFDMAMPKSKSIARQRFQEAVNAIVTELE